MKALATICALTTALAITAADAQPKNPFAAPQNLKILPDDINPGQLRDIMRKFSFSTGIRCSGCHVQAEGKPLNEWDFSLDDKRQKKVARDMLRMTSNINKSVGGMEGLKARDKTTVRVTCMTCHRGVPRPEMIQDILDTYKDKNDAAAGVTHYRELREIYYGSHAYDFTPFTLGNYALDLTGEGKVDYAMALHALNRELHPENANAYALWGQSLMQTGDFEGAAGAFRKALELAPDNQFVKGLLARAERALREQTKDE